LSEQILAVRTEPGIGGAQGSLTETFMLLQDDPNPGTDHRNRLRRLIELLETCEKECGLISRRRDPADLEAEDEDPDPAVLVEATLTSNGEQMTQYVFEDLTLFRASLTVDRLALLRTVRRHGPMRPDAAANMLGRESSEIVSDVRALTLLGLITESRKGLRVDFDELTLTIKLEG
jgi:predicted transcriptional regulator